MTPNVETDLLAIPPHLDLGLRRLLIVDDDRDALYSFQRIFQHGPITVQVADSGDDALDQICRWQFDCVLMDVRMPGMDGLETLRQLQQRQPGLPVILMTAFADGAGRQEALHLGAFDFLRKPVDVPLLRQVVMDGLAAGELNRLMPAEWPRDLRQMLPGESAAIQSIRSALDTTLVQVLRNERGDLPTVLRIQGGVGTGRRSMALGIHRLVSGVQQPIPYMLQWSEPIGQGREGEKGSQAFTSRLSRSSGTLIVLGVDQGLSPSQAQAILKHLDSVRHRGRALPLRLLIMVEERGHETAGETGSGHHPYTLLRLPDLSDRPEDIPEMAQQLALQICRELGRSVPPGGTALTDRFSRRLGGLKWPGQVPQLKSTLRNILAHAEELPLASAPGFEPTLDEIDGLDQAEPGAQRIAKPQEDLIPVAILDRLFDEIRHIQPLPPGLDLFDIVERHLIIRSLQLHHGNQSRAARQLGITRNTLRKRVAKYGFGLIP